jgi:D-lactate dehydrogenase (cytochrome)
MTQLTDPREVEPYLSDASQFRGQAEGVFVPESEKEIREFLSESNARKRAVTVSGGKTGLTGAAVPQGGWVLSLGKLSKTLEIREDPAGGPAWARFEPGISLRELEETLEKRKSFYPPDPTGKRAFLGGTLATNASGPNSLKYGPTRRYIRRIRTVLATGEVLELRRGQIFARPDGTLEIPLADRTLKVTVPHYRFPAVKHAGGYFAEPGMDAIDLFIGSEGTLGVITEIEVSLLPRPETIGAFLIFFREEEDSWCFAASVRQESRKRPQAGEAPGLEARVIEYFDAGSLEFLRPLFPSIPKAAKASLFIEQEAGEKTEKALSARWQEWIERQGPRAAITDVWTGIGAEKQKEFREFRSRLPAEIRDFLAEHKQLKIGTDTCVPPNRFEELMLFHRQKVEAIGVPSVTFGHIGECHVHLNLLPRNDEERQKSRALYGELLQKAIALGGTFSAEHGAGKLKRAYLAQLLGKGAIREMIEIKRLFDPNLILGRGNIFEIE